MAILGWMQPPNALFLANCLWFEYIFQDNDIFIRKMLRVYRDACVRRMELVDFAKSFFSISAIASITFLFGFLSVILVIWWGAEQKIDFLIVFIAYFQLSATNLLFMDCVYMHNVSTTITTESNWKKGKCETSYCAVAVLLVSALWFCLL